MKQVSFVAKLLNDLYSTVSNKRGGSNKRGELQILEKIKIKLWCTDAKSYINCITLITFIIGTRENVNKSGNVRNLDDNIIKYSDFQPILSQNK